VRSDKNWKSYFRKFLNIENDKQNRYLTYFSEISLIDKDELAQGHLSNKKLSERSDDYTNKVRRKYGQGTDNIPLEQIRIEENRTDKNTYGEFQKVRLTLEEFSKLKERLGEKNTLILISELDSYIASKGKRYTSHYATILTWARKRFTEHQEKLQAKKTNLV
jgi:hypothetical protein